MNGIAVISSDMARRLAAMVEDWERLRPLIGHLAATRAGPTVSVWVSPSGSPTAGVYAGTFQEWNNTGGVWASTGEACKVREANGTTLTAGQVYHGRIVGEDSGLPLIQIGGDPDASTTVRGYVNTTTQSFAGDKTFTGNVAANSLGVTTNAAVGGNLGVTGDATVGGDLDVGGTLTAATAVIDDLTVTTTMTVDGIADFNNDLLAHNDVVLDGDTFRVGETATGGLLWDAASNRFTLYRPGSSASRIELEVDPDGTGNPQLVVSSDAADPEVATDRFLAYDFYRASDPTAATVRDGVSDAGGVANISSGTRVRGGIVWNFGTGLSVTKGFVDNDGNTHAVVIARGFIISWDITPGS